MHLQSVNGRCPAKRFVGHSAVAMLVATLVFSCFAVMSLSLSQYDQAWAADTISADDGSGSAYDLIVNPSEDDLAESLCAHSLYGANEALAKSAAKQLARCELLSGTIVLANLDTMCAYQDGIKDYTFDATTLSDGKIAAGDTVILRYLYGAGDEYAYDADIPADYEEALEATYATYEVGEDGFVTVSLYGGGVYALGEKNRVSAIEIVPTVAATSSDSNSSTDSSSGGPSGDSSGAEDDSGLASNAASSVVSPIASSVASALAAMVGVAATDVSAADGTSTDVLAADEEAEEAVSDSDSAAQEAGALVDEDAASSSSNTIALICLLVLLVLAALVIAWWLHTRKKAAFGQSSAAEEAVVVRVASLSMDAATYAAIEAARGKKDEPIAVVGAASFSMAAAVSKAAADQG